MATVPEQKDCDKSCEFCEGVDRSVDNLCHTVYGISDRCPLYQTVQLYKKNARIHLGIETVTRKTGCIYFKLDEEYKRRNEEIERILRDRHGN